MNQSFIYLASASPRRGALLSQIGVDYRVHAVQIDESRQPQESVRDYVLRLAREKAMAAVATVGRSVPVLAADTVVVIDDIALGKPQNRSHGLRMLKDLSARRHRVLTGVAIVDAQGTRSIVNETAVRFRAIEEQECEQYWATGEPVDKAGGYAIQGLAAVFIEDIEGSYSGVMGLPLFETAKLLRECGIEVLQQQVN